MTNNTLHKPRKYTETPAGEKASVRPRSSERARRLTSRPRKAQYISGAGYMH
jgi:hypothetical protein